MLELREGLDAGGRSRFERWFSRLDAVAAAKVTTALYRLRHGNRSNIRAVGGGVSELRIDFGPGYRVYFGRTGDAVVVLLGGGSKKRQSAEIAAARRFWLELRRCGRSKLE